MAVMMAGMKTTPFFPLALSDLRPGPARHGGRQAPRLISYPAPYCRATVPRVLLTVREMLPTRLQLFDPSWL